MEMTVGILHFNKGKSLELSTEEQFTMDIKNKIDYGISAGLGMELIAKKRHSILLEGRFYYGLNNIFNSRKKDTFAASNGMSIMVSDFVTPEIGWLKSADGCVESLSLCDLFR